MFELYISFCVDCIDRHISLLIDSEGALHFLQILMNKVFPFAFCNNLVNDAILCEFAVSLLQLGYEKDALQMLEQALHVQVPEAAQMFKSSLNVWLLYIRMLARRENRDLKQIEKVIDEAIKHLFDSSIESEYLQNLKNLAQHQEEYLRVKVEQAARRMEFWNTIIPFLMLHEKDKQIVEQYFKNAVKTSNCFEIKRKYFDWCVMNRGVDGGQEAAKA